MLVTAVLTFLAHAITAGARPALFNVMAVLLVACPSALGFATPVAVWTAMRRLQNLGFHVKRGDAIEKLAAVNLAVFDKTGTLGVPDPLPALRVEPRWRSEQIEVEELVSAAEAPLNHPFARILAQMRSGGAGYHTASVRVEPGKGVAAEVETPARVVRHVRIAGESGKPETASLSVEIDGHRAATTLLREQKRPHAGAVPDSLRSIGIDTVLMTGDRIERTTQFGFTNVQELKEQGYQIVFTGDGHSSRSRGGPFAADSVHRLAAPRFDRLAGAIAICRDTVRLVRTNLRFALAYNVIGIAIAAVGFLHPIVAVMLMTVSSCILVFRSLRLLDENDPARTAMERRPEFVTALVLAAGVITQASCRFLLPFNRPGRYDLGHQHDDRSGTLTRRVP